MIRDKKLRFGDGVTHAATVTTDPLVFHEGMGKGRAMNLMVSGKTGSAIAGDFIIEHSADGGSWATLMTIPVTGMDPGVVGVYQPLPPVTLDQVRVRVASGTGTGTWDAELIWQ